MPRQITEKEHSKYREQGYTKHFISHDHTNYFWDLDNLLIRLCKRDAVFFQLSTGFWTAYEKENQ